MRPIYKKISKIDDWWPVDNLSVSIETDAEEIKQANPEHKIRNAIVIAEKYFLKHQLGSNNQYTLMTKEEVILLALDICAKLRVIDEANSEDKALPF